MKLLLILSVTLLAVVSLLAADVHGVWAFEIKWSGRAPGTPVFTLSQDGEKLSGTYEGGLGTTPVTGTVKGNSITLTVSNPNGNVKVNGTLTSDGREIRGQASFEVTDGTHDEGSFVAKRKASL